MAGLEIGYLWLSLQRVLSKDLLVSKAKRSMLLNLARVKHDTGHLEARILHDLEQAQFGSIEALLNLFQSQSDRVSISRFSCSTDTQTGMRFRQPHEMPVRTRTFTSSEEAVVSSTDIQLHKRALDSVPVQEAAEQRAQEDRILLHACDFLIRDTPDASLLRGAKLHRELALKNVHLPQWSDLWNQVPLLV